MRSTSFVLTFVCLALAAWAIPRAAGASTTGGPPICFPGFNGHIICKGVKSGGSSGSSGSSGTAGASGQPLQVYIEIGQLEAATANHPVCWVPMADNVTGGSPATIAQIKQFWKVVESVFPPCPGVVAATASQWASEYWTAYWYARRLPEPRPSIPPGYAITGLPAYLVCGDGDLVTVDRPTPLGTLAITARATYNVDWGDGTTSLRQPGSSCTPWPGGKVDHTYDYVGTYTVSVVETWQVTWTLGAASGSFQDVQTTGTLARFHVHQVEAVGSG